MLFQEAVAIRFGFIACSLEAGNQHLHYQYIHLSGNQSNYLFYNKYSILVRKASEWCNYIVINVMRSFDTIW